MSCKSNTTAAVRAGIETETQWGAVVPPLHLSSNYSFAGIGRPRRYDYSRTANPTRDQLAAALAELEGGAGAVITSSGMAAIALVLQLVEPGDLVVAPHDGYGGTYRLLRALAARGAFELVMVDQRNREALDTALAGGASLLWVESPSNPLLRVTDLAHVAAAGHAAGALVAVDNTFLSPALQNPIRFGADLVAHSTTKYLNGHSDVVGGAVVAAHPDLVERLCYWANCIGLGGSPFDSYLTLRGVRTLHARMRVHEDNARALAAALARDDRVAEVHWPGLECHPEHALASAQARGFGGMLSFELEPEFASRRALAALVDGLEHFTLAESLGGVESLVAHPATMTHAAMEPDARAAAGIGDGLLRVSAGIEAADDLVADLTAALDRAAAASQRTIRAERM